MTQQDKEQLKLEIDHIFESGANEIRIFEMVVNFIDSRNGVNKNFVLANVSCRFYRGYTIRNHGYYPHTDKCVWWEAVNDETGEADFHAKRLRDIISMINEALGGQNGC